jgi:hypothetical protein
MYSCDHLEHPFQQDAGTGKSDRMPGNLSGSSTPIDGRQTSDLLNYFSGLAGQIKFYQDDGSTTNWRSFFQNHLPFQLSQMDTLTGDQIRSGMAAAVTQFSRNPDANGLQLLFLQTYYTAIWPLQQWSTLLANTGLTVETQLNTTIKDRLLSPLQAYLSWLNTAVFGWHIQPPDLTGLAANPVWELTPALLSAYQPSFSYTVPSNRSQLLTVQTALTDIVNAFADVVDTGAVGVADLVNKKLYALLKNNGLANTPPHLAVLYAFLSQYQKVVKDLNGLTGKQLNFFFQKVLKLSPGLSIPDQAYVVFTIQKQIPSYTIPAATTTLKSGKDSKGSDIYFKLNADATVNQAQVAAVQTVFVNTSPWGKSNYVEGVYMAPNAQMADGISKSFTDPSTAAWPTLGAQQSLYTPPLATGPIDYPAARLGFVLASKVLYLKEGKRKIHIQLVCEWNPCGCNDGVSFHDVFEWAHESVCSRFAVITTDILTQAGQAGVSADTIKAIQEKYLKDKCDNRNPCPGAPASLLDKHLIRIQCCDPPKMDSDDKVARVEMEFSETDVEVIDLDVSQRCPGDWKEAYCAKSAYRLLKKELEKIAGIQPEEVKILQQLLVLQNLFDVGFSGEQGWQAPDYLEMRLEQLPAGTVTGSADCQGTQQLIWHIYATIATGSPGIIFYDPTKMGEDLNVTDPLVRIELNNNITWKIDDKTPQTTTTCLAEPDPVCNQQVSPYEFFRNLTLLVPMDKTAPYKTSIDVKVCGVQTLVVQNDSGLLNVNSAFTPFGVKPLIPDFVPIPAIAWGTTTYGTIDGPNFYIGSTEVLLKKWTELHLRMSWLSKPESFDNFYAGYVPTTTGFSLKHLDGNYKVKVAWLQNGLWHGLTTVDGECELFPGCHPSFPVCCGQDYHDTFHFEPGDFQDPDPVYDPDFTPITKWVAGMQRGFLRMTLEKQDFLHKYYTTVMGKSMQNPSAYPNIINEPWTPNILPGMAIDYSASAFAEDMTLVQLYPFDGTSNVVNIYGMPTLMAQFCAEGHLFIGLTGLLPGQSLNLLFQLAEATAGAGIEAGKLTWHYLANNEWKQLRSGFELAADGTQGLTRTGILQINFPDDISNTSTVLPTGNYWMMARMKSGTAATSRTIAIIPQAQLATYAPVPGVNDPNRSATPLPAQSITKLTQPDPNVIKIAQPYPSFGGSAPEASGDAYMTRVSERLRHKGRAIQAWDYERLVLQQFPQVLRVKCINHSYYLDSGAYKYDFPMAPGNILVAVLPDPTQLTVANALQPSVPASMLQDITTFLQTMQSPFVNVTVVGPRYEPVTICATVEFGENENGNARAAQLEQLLQGLLAPWLGGDLDEFGFGQPVYVSDVVDLIQSQSYVVNLTSLTINHADDPAETGNQQGFIAPRTPRSILVAGTLFVNAATTSVNPATT